MPVARKFLLVSLLVTSPWSATPAAAEALSWAASVAETGANNAELRAASLNVDAAQNRERAAHSGFFPQLSAGASHSNVEGDTLVGSSSGYNASLVATQNLFAGFQDRALVEQAAGGREITQATFDATRARISQELKTAYAGLRLAQDNIELTANIERRLEENVRLVQLRFEGGRENRGSYLLTRASFFQGQYDSLQARQALLAARTQLARVLGRPEPGELSASEDVPISIPPPEPVFPELVPGVPDYRVARAQENVAAADLRLARSGFYPSVDVSGSIVRNRPDGFADGERRSVTTSVTIPLFSGGRDYYTARGAVASRESAARGKDDVERQVLVRLRQTYNAYVESVERLKVDQAFLEAAIVRAEIARGRYSNGLMSFEDWDRIENELILRQKALLVSRRERVTAEAAWEQVQGQGVLP